MHLEQQTVSVIHDKTLTYPDSADYFSPSEAFPEYQFKHFAKKSNRAYTAVRQCLAEAGLDSENFGKPTWNPLRGYVRPGQKVFILCNFVKHNIAREPEVMLAKCTHGSVVRAVIDYVLVALRGRGSVLFGNAPLQSADWERLRRETGAQTVEDFYTGPGRGDVPVQLVDLRQHIVHRSVLGRRGHLHHEGDAQFCVPVDIASDSLLETFYDSGETPRFRVLDYDHRRTERCHSKGRHVYLVNKLILESEVVVSIPKLKTHEKVGITCGIKGCVGAVGHKDSLAHHRYGPPRLGGDEYPDKLAILAPLSKLHDAVYHRDPGFTQRALHLLNHLSRVTARRFTRCLSGAWPGNDTCWRMAVDLARIIEYANSSGRMLPEKQRVHIMITDGIIAGEGDGPLSPRPVPFGYLSFSDNVAVGDFVNCMAMGYDPAKVPMVREAFLLDEYRLAEDSTVGKTVTINGQSAWMNGIGSAFSRKFAPPREWRQCL